MKRWANVLYLASIISYILALAGMHTLFYFVGCSLFLLGYYLNHRKKA